MLFLARCWSRAASSRSGFSLMTQTRGPLCEETLVAVTCRAVVLDGDGGLVGPGPVQVLDEQALVVTLFGASSRAVAVRRSLLASERS